MPPAKYSASIHFVDTSGERRFLFQLMNIGRDTDDLKFIFNSPSASTAVIYSEKEQKYPEESMVRSYAEITYHHDGSVLYKFPQRKKDENTVYHNPHGTGHRRTPLNDIGEWDPIVQGKIVRYRDCRREDCSDAVELPPNPIIFNGEPFEYIVFLGSLRYQNPPNAAPQEMIFRINDVARGIDMLIWLFKSDYRGVPFRIGSTEAWNDLNVIQVVEKNV